MADMICISFRNFKIEFILLTMTLDRLISKAYYTG